MSRKDKKARQRERAFYQKTQRHAGRRDLQNDIKKKPQRRGMTPAWTYKVGAVGGSLALVFAVIFGLQGLGMTLTNMSADVRAGEAAEVGIFHNFGLTGVYLVLAFVVWPILCAFFWYCLLYTSDAADD